MFRTERLPEAEIYEILANRRRRETIRRLSVDADGGSLSVRELSEEIAASETGRSPPPRDVRESVYNALHQTHLPKLEQLGVIAYDREASEVRLRDSARDVNVYMGITTRYGLTWSEIYQALGIGGLTTVVGSLAGVPLASSIDPILWASGFLVAFVVATASRLWSNRWYLWRALRNR
jgi:hypothetical protein